MEKELIKKALKVHRIFFLDFFLDIRGKRGRRVRARIRCLPVRQSKSDSKMG